MIYFFPFFFVACNLPGTSNSITFSREYEPIGCFYSVKQIEDSGYITAGVQFDIVDEGPINGNLRVLKTNQWGVTIWDNIYAEDCIDAQLVLSNDGGYLISISAYVADALEQRLIKIDSQGNKEWVKDFGLKTRLHLTQRLIKCKNEEDAYLLSGFSSSTDNFLLKINGEGEEIWKQNYTTEFISYSSDAFYIDVISETNDGGYILAGECTVPNNEYSNYLVRIKTDKDGNILWMKYNDFTMGQTHVGYIHENQNGDFIIFMDIRFGDEDKRYISMYKIDNNGNLLSSKDLSGYNLGEPVITSVKRTYDGNFIILIGGHERNEEINNMDTIMQLKKISPEGEEVWAKEAINYTLFCTEQTKDKGYILSGSINDNFTLVKTDELGNSTIWGE